MVLFETTGVKKFQKEVSVRMSLPKDPVMLLSVINTYLRDQYTCMEELCAACSVQKKDVDEKLEMIDYHYDPDQNQYV